jgi:microcystin-dependent protein
MGISSGLAGAVGAVPIGVVNPFAGATAPSGWLLCAGQAVSRSQYSGLFAVISTTYGAGDGSTTFAVPDLRGRVVAGVDNMGGTAASRLTSTTITGGGDANGEVGGAQTHTLTSGESGVPAHSHPINNVKFNSNTSHTHSGQGGFLAEAADNSVSVGTAAATNNNTAANASSAHNNVQPTMVLNYIIKAQ